MPARPVVRPLVVTAAALVHLSDGVIERAGLALSGVGGRPVRATAATDALVGRAPSDDAVAAAADAATADLEPFSDVYGSGRYRKKLAAVLARRALSTAIQRAGDER